MKLMPVSSVPTPESAATRDNSRRRRRANRRVPTAADRRASRSWRIRLSGYLTAFGLLSFVVGLFIVNSAIGLAFEQRLPMLRTLRACGVSARLLNAVLVIELVALAFVAGIVGLICGYVIAASLLPDVAASLARSLWRANPRSIDAKGRMVGRRTRHQRSRRIGGSDRKPDKGDTPSRAGNRAALCLATGAASMVASARRACARRIRRRGRLSVAWRFPCFRICRARGVAAWRRPGPAGDP